MIKYIIFLKKNACPNIYHKINFSIKNFKKLIYILTLSNYKLKLSIHFDVN